MADCPELYKTVQIAIIECLESNGISALNVDAMALPYTMIRDAAIRQRYYEQIAPGNSEGLREELAKEHGLKLTTVKDILYKKKPFK